MTAINDRDSFYCYRRQNEKTGNHLTYREAVTNFTSLIDYNAHHGIFLKVMILFNLLLLPELLQAAAVSLPAEPIRFVITNYKQEQQPVIVTLPPEATLKNLHEEIAHLCNVPFPFTITLAMSSNETIVSPETSARIKRRSVLYHPSVNPMVQTLREFWGEDFQIPIRIYRWSPSEQDIATYTALDRMFDGLEPNTHKWYQIIKQCAKSKQCSIQFLAIAASDQRFRVEKGILTAINLSGQRLSGYLNLSALPASVQKLRCDRNSLTQIFGLDQLAGKQLKTLDVRYNLCEIKLRPFEKASPLSIGNPLRNLKVRGVQIKDSLVFNAGEASLKRSTAESIAAGQVWIKESVLDNLCIENYSIRRRYVEQLMQQQSAK